MVTAALTALTTAHTTHPRLHRVCAAAIEVTTIQIMTGWLTVLMHALGTVTRQLRDFAVATLPKRCTPGRSYVATSPKTVCGRRGPTGQHALSCVAEVLVTVHAQFPWWHPALVSIALGDPSSRVAVTPRLAKVGSETQVV